MPRRPLPRTDRLDLVLSVLRDRPGITAAGVAEDLGTSVRSIFRDVAALRERGYPIEADRGRGGGLRLHPSWGLSRVMLSTEEALGTLLALAITEKLGLPMFAPEIGRARRRIMAAFPLAERRRLTPLRERILIGRAASAAVRASYGTPDIEVTRRLQTAFIQERSVRAEYVREDGRRTWRPIEPHGILINWPAWYLLGWDRERLGARTFRFDRFRSVDPGDGAPFRPRARQLAAEALGESGVPDQTM